MDIYTIYKATNLINGKSYIGFTSKLLIVRQHKHQKMAKNNSLMHFHKAIRKYGWENFEWEVLYTSNDLDFTKNIMEGYFIRTFDTYNKGYNQTLGGEGTCGFSHREKTRNLLSEQRKNKPGNKHSEQHIQKITGPGNPFFNKKHSEETKRKISNSKKGIKINLPPKTKEHKEAISKTKKGKGIGKKRYYLSDGSFKILYPEDFPI